MINPILWLDNKLKLLDQTLLPHKIEYYFCQSVDDVIFAIKTMIVRGAPAIGISAGYGLVLGAIALDENSPTLIADLAIAADKLKQSRPTAINLAWAVDHLMSIAINTIDKKTLINELTKTAIKLHQEDIIINKQIGANGCALFPDNARVMTICNTGALATAGYGTALGVIRNAIENKKLQMVYPCETRPRLQGARLTAWELREEGIPFKLISDGMAGMVMRKKMVDCVIAGADRIALNGDTANKIGTYSLAVLANHHNIPFYIAAPTSTFDFNIQTGDEIPIEEREATEITYIENQPIAPDNIQVYNPSFDVTPGELITAIITERGVIRQSYINSIKELQSIE